MPDTASSKLLNDTSLDWWADEVDHGRRHHPGWCLEAAIRSHGEALSTLRDFDRKLLEDRAMSAAFMGLGIALDQLGQFEGAGLLFWRGALAFGAIGFAVASWHARSLPVVVPLDWGDEGEIAGSYRDSASSLNEAAAGKSCGHGRALAALVVSAMCMVAAPLFSG